MIGNNDDSSCGPPGKGYDNQQIPSGDGVQQDREGRGVHHQSDLGGLTDPEDEDGFFPYTPFLNRLVGKA